MLNVNETHPGVGTGALKNITFRSRAGIGENQRENFFLYNYKIALDYKAVNLPSETGSGAKAKIFQRKRASFGAKD